MISVRSVVLAALGCAALGTACRSPASTSTQSLVPTTFFPYGVTAFVASVTTVYGSPVTGTKKAGQTAAGAAALSLTVDGQPTVVSNGGSLITLHGSAPFSRVLVSIANSGAVVDGFWEVDLPAAATDLTVLVRFVTSLPAPAFDLHFQVASPAGVVSQPAIISATVATSVATVLPSVVASYNPSQVPFENGAPCTFTTELGCLWEFKVLLQEFNGVAVTTATLTETYTFTSGETTTNAVPIIIPGAGIGTIVRTVTCGTATITCIPADELAGGTYTYTVNGTDVNGVAFTFTGPVLTILGR